MSPDREAHFPSRERETRFSAANRNFVLAAAAALTVASASCARLGEDRSARRGETASPVAVNEPRIHASVSAADRARMWPRFRGPGGLGISAYANVPVSWDGRSGKNILWKSPVPLPGNNSPVVWGDRVFLSGADETRREVYCFDAGNGDLLWRKGVPGTPESTRRVPKVFKDTGLAAPTVTTDGRHVFAIFANGDVAAFGHDGRLAWSRSLGIPENRYGHASSLVMVRDRLLVQLDQGEVEAGKSRLIALGAADGRILWETRRPVGDSWPTPIVISVGGKPQIVTAAAPCVIAYAPDGNEIWRARCLRHDVGPSPTFAGGRVFVANEFPALSAIRADGGGDVTETGILWQAEDGLPDTSSPLATPRHVFLLASYGVLTCYDAENGEWLWDEEFDSAFVSSPSLVGTRLYLVGRKGEAWVVEPRADGCERVAEAHLGEECVTTPAFQDGRMYLRGKEHLFCIGHAE